MTKERRISFEDEKIVSQSSPTRVAISDRKNRQNRIGVGKFSDRPEFGRQSRQILSEKSGNRQNRRIGKIGRSAKSADRQKSAKTPPRAKKRADWMSSGRRLYHTHTFTTPLHQTQTARFFNSQLLLFDWLKLSTACHAQTQYPLTRF